MTAKRPTKAKLDAWAVDQLDPDNYFQVPELGVMPADVNFVGFKDPIVSPESDHYEARKQVRTLVGFYRYQARKTFGTLKELEAADAAGIRAMSEDLPATPEQRTAMLYKMVCGNFRYAFSEKGSSERMVLKLTSAALGFAGFAFYDSRFGLKKVASQRVVNRRSAAKKRGSGKNLSVDDMAAFCNERRGLKYEVLIAEAAEVFGTSETTARRRYSEAQKRKLVP